MAGKKREVKYFAEIQSDEEFEKLLGSTALLILDVYQDLFGPCTIGLHGTLERAKVSLVESDKLQLATCNANKVDKLIRFRGKSIPTMVFVHDGKIIDIMYGSNIPLLQEKIRENLKKIESLTPLESVDFHEMLPFEREDFDRKNAIEIERARIEREKAEAERLTELNNMIQLMNSNASDMGVTLFMPHVVDVATRKTLETAKWLSLVNRAQKVVQLTPELMKTLTYQLDNPIDEAILEEIYGKNVLVVLWYTDPRNPITEVLAEFVKSVTEPRQMYDEDGILIPGAFEPSILESLIIKFEDNDNGDEEAEEGKSIEEKIVSRESSSVVEISVASEEVEEENNRLVIPPVWTPENQTGNAVFMYTLFRNQFGGFLPSLPEPEPPHLCMIFPASKYKDVLSVCEEFPSGVLSYGFFEGDTFEDFQLCCKTVEHFQRLFKTKKEKMIMKVAKKTSNLMLALTAISPLYVSLNTDDGEKECSLIFNDDFYALEDVVSESEEEEEEAEFEEPIDDMME